MHEKAGKAAPHKPNSLMHKFYQSAPCRLLACNRIFLVGYSVGYTLPQNASFVFEYTAYACNWTLSAQDFVKSTTGEA